VRHIRDVAAGEDKVRARGQGSVEERARHREDAGVLAESARSANHPFDFRDHRWMAELAGLAEACGKVPRADEDASEPFHTADRIEVARRFAAANEAAGGSRP
jgi:hypothetical protein